MSKNNLAAWSGKRDRSAILFDFDGTLATVTIDFDRMREQAFSVARKFFPAITHPNGTPVLEWIETQAQTMRLHDAPAAQAMEDAVHLRLREIEIDAATRGHLLPFTRDLLANLRRDGISVGIVTRNCTPAIDAVFPDCHLFSQVTLTRDDVHRVKPHPEHLHTALRTLGASPSNAIMVGDHPLDMQAGRKCGSLSAGVLTGTSTEASLMAGGAHVVAQDAAKLVKSLTRIDVLAMRNRQPAGNRL